GTPSPASTSGTAECSCGAGAGLLQAPGLRELQGGFVLPLAVGTITSAVTGYGIRLLRQKFSEKT
ncbi:MAG: hypothetical protein ACE5OR_11150, partial [bacterium]